MATEKYIFNWDAQDLFYEKLDDLHEKYVESLILSGVSPHGADLESIKMTKNPTVTKEYCKKVVGGLVHIKPQTIVSLLEDKKLLLQCIFTQISKSQTFMIQNVINWPEFDKFSCQIWLLSENSVMNINNHWI